MYIVKNNLANIKCNLTFSSVGEYKSIFQNFNIKKKKKKERATNLSKTRLSEAVPTNLMEQLGSLKETFGT